LNWQQRRLSVAPAWLRQFSRSDPCPHVGAFHCWRRPRLAASGAAGRDGNQRQPAPGAARRGR
ncbi:MAG: hypothetical protein WAO08_30975, partial [Hyphomicrobiaceae bacterium]